MKKCVAICKKWVYYEYINKQHHIFSKGANIMNNENILTDGRYTTIKELKRGDFFKLSDKPNANVYIRGEYDKSEKKYCCEKYFDMNDWRMFKGNKIVITDFTF